MPRLADKQAERVLAVIAHPDDAEFWFGGSVAGWTDVGVEVSYCVLTDGDSGGFDPGFPARRFRGSAGMSSGWLLSC